MSGGEIMTEKEILTRLARVEGEIARRKENDALSRYNRDKVHEKQIAFHKCGKRNRWVFGGNRSGKTECGAAETVWRARGNHPYRENRRDSVGWVVSLTREVQRDVAQKKILQYLSPDWIEEVVMVSGRSGSPESGVIDLIRVRNVFGGISVIGFKSCEAGRAKFQGASLDYVWFDEEPPEEIYDECRMRVIDRRGDIYGTMTPLLGLTFAYRRIFMGGDNDPETWYIFMEWADNPYLDREEIERATATMSREELEARRYGRFVSNKGLVYPEFDERIHVIEPFDVPPEWQDTLSIDPGLNNPLACLWFAVDGDGTVYVTAEHYEAGKNVEYHCRAIERLSGALNWHRGSAGRIEALIDSAAGQHTLAGSKSVSELFFDYGIAVNPKVNKDLFAGISRVKSYLKGADGRPKIYIFDTCVNLVREMKSYFWGSGDMPRKKDDHALDSLRYYIMSRPEAYVPPARRKSAVELDKERLLRRMRRCRRR